MTFAPDTDALEVHASPPGIGRRRAGVLVVSCVASYLVVSDVAMVNVALPSISDSLHLSSADVHWFLTCYALAFSALPLLAGRIADRLGHARVFAIGVALFSLAAAVCGGAQNRPVLEVARAVQGVGGSIVAATTLSLLTVTFTERAARRRALAAWSATVSGGAAAGVLLGGVVTAELSWRWVFLASAAIGALCLLITVPRLTRRMEVTAQARHLDLVGGLLISAGLGCVVLGLAESQIHGWGSGSALLLLAAGALMLSMFFAAEHRSPDPLLPIELLRSRGRVGANTVTAIVGADLYFMYFAVSVYLQRVAGNGPLSAGVKSLPAALAVVTGALASTWLARKMSPRRQLVGAMIITAVGFLWLSRLTVGTGYWSHVGLPLIVVGLGFGTSFVPATVLATSGVPVDRAGVASGLVNSSRQLGRALGLAALSGLAVAAGGSDAAATIVRGDSRAFMICAGAALAAATVAWLLVPRTATDDVADAPVLVTPTDGDTALT